LPSVVLITGAATGIGNLTARALAEAGHAVYAGVLGSEGLNADHARGLIEFGRAGGHDVHIVDLDVTSDSSAEAAVAAVLADAGRLDAVVHNAGHLCLGYVEAFTAEDMAEHFDVNVFGVQRVNRAVLPHMRERGSGTLIYVGSTALVVVPPFMGPYVASKFAVDALAQVTSYEVGQLGIETTIVTSGPFTKGSEHFPNAGHPSDRSRIPAYSALDPLVAATADATAALFPPNGEFHPHSVAAEIARVLALPAGRRPFRTVVDFTNAGVERVAEISRKAAEDYVTRLGCGRLLHVVVPCDAAQPAAGPAAGPAPAPAGQR
jgi:NAD(P)-dependent dehydrogenase (short-subunit alcohol dehydrogenase family)